MAKAANNKSPEEASNLFHNIMKASLKGSPKDAKPIPTLVTQLEGLEVHFQKMNADGDYLMIVPETGVSLPVLKVTDKTWEVMPFASISKFNEVISNIIWQWEFVKEHDL